jgi:hypothetical protein
MYTSYLPGHKARLQQPYVLLLLLLLLPHQHVAVDDDADDDMGRAG